jgi:hypothetical protein
VPSVDEIKARRARQGARRRRRRQLTAVVVAVVVVAALAAGVLAVKRMGDRGAAKPKVVKATHTPKAKQTATRSATPKATASPGATPSPKATKTATPTPTPVAAAKPPITKDFIDYSPKRQAEMAAYSLKHYGTSDIHLRPKVIVLHYTCGSDYGSAHATFSADVPNNGVLPGVVTQFVIDKDGTVYQQIPLGIEGRHTVGLNYAAIGIECVQECPSGDAQAVAAILGREKEATALVELVRWLMRKYDIPLANVIGHGAANDSPYYKDRMGWKNDHTDWLQPQVAKFRKLITAGG